MANKQVRAGLGARLFLSFLLVSLAGVGICAVLVDRNVRQNAKAQVQERLTYEVVMLGQMTANALFGAIDPKDTTTLAGVVAQLADAVHTNLSLLAQDGTVVADSEEADVSKLEKQSTVAEVVQALATGTGVSVRVWRNEPRIFVAQTIQRDGSTLGIARASVPMAAIDEVASNVRRQMSYGGLAAIAVAVILAALVSLGILRPVRKLADGAKKIGEGDLKHRVDVDSSDEIGDLARALNDMSAHLQAMVGKLDQRNDDMRLVLDNVAQGLVTVGKDGAIAEERSKAIDTWFGAPKAGTKLWDVFEPTTPALRMALSLGWEQVFDDVLPLELTLSQLPRRVQNAGRHFELGYEPIVGSNSALDKLLLVVSDVTSVVAAEQSEAAQREQMNLFTAVAKDRNGVSDFLNETGKLVQFVSAHALEPSRVVEVKRSIHTIKGNCGLFGLTSLSTLCHEIETRMVDAAADAVVGTVDRDALQDAWGSLVRRAQELLGNVSSNAIEVTAKEVAQLVISIQQGKSPDTLIRAIATWSMDPVDKRLLRLAEQARQLAARMGKSDVTVEVKPSDVRLPVERWAPFWNTLSHAIRNALDHGIESPEERLKASKPEHGALCLSATETSREVVVEIADDGRGINWAKVREKATQLGLPSESEADLSNALFADGVSTRDEATEFSGRGVGLSAVRTACEELGGHVEIESAIGLGTKLRFWFPAPGVLDAVTKLKSSLSIPPRAGTSTAPPRASDAPRSLA